MLALGDDKVIEIGLYKQDLLMTQSTMSNEYGARRAAGVDAVDFTGASGSPKPSAWDLIAINFKF